MIREYKTDDRDEVMAVWDAASAIAHPFLSDEFQAKVHHDIAHVYLPITETWVWEADGQIAGFISLYGNEIGGLFVSPNFQRQGVGKALLARAQAGRESLDVEVFCDNLIGRSFYDSTGFVLVEQKDHPESGFPVLRLRLTGGDSATG